MDSRELPFVRHRNWVLGRGHFVEPGPQGDARGAHGEEHRAARRYLRQRLRRLRCADRTLRHDYVPVCGNRLEEGTRGGRSCLPIVRMWRDAAMTKGWVRDGTALRKVEPDLKNGF